MAVEARRGCGYRKIGGLYLVGGGISVSCDRLPFPLTVCPVCSCGIKQTRGWTWVRVAELFGGKHTCLVEPGPACTCSAVCPVCAGTIERGGLLWIGEKFYPSPYAFDAEARTLGISRRIHAVPRGFKVGETWDPARASEGPLVEIRAGDVGQELTPGIFRVWRPDKIEKLYPESARDSAEVADDVAKGITPVFVPDDDPDHRGSVHDTADDEQQELAGVSP